MSNPIIAFIGAGNMAASLIGGLRAQGVPASVAKARDSRRHSRNSRLKVAKPPNKCPVTTCGHSFSQLRCSACD